MFEAFKIGITIALTNTVSTALAAMSKDFAATDAKAIALKKTLNEIKVLGTLGAVSGAIGYAGFKILDESYQVAKNYEMAFARFKALNLGDVMNRNADNFARATDAIGVSSTEMMATLRDLTAVTGDPKLAMQLAPKFAQMSFSNKAVFGEHGMRMDEAQIRALEKVIEMKGGYKDEKTFLAQAEMMQKVISGTGGMVKPSDFLAFIKTAGVSGRLLDNEAFYYTMEPLIQEMSGNRVGTGTMSGYNNLAQGKSTVRAAREMMRIGILNKDDVVYDKIGQVKYIKPGGLKGFDQYTTAPYPWMQSVLIPALNAAGMTTQQAMMNEMGAIFGNRKGSDLFSLMLMQQEKIDKNVAIDKNAMGRVELLGLALKTPKGAEEAFTAAMDRLQTAMGRSLVPLVIPALLGFANALNKLSDAAAHHPTIARDLMYAAVGITAFFSIGGVLLLGTASLLGFKLALVGLGSVLTGFGAAGLLATGWIALIIAGVAAAYEVYAHWEEIKPKLMSIWHGITDWLDGLFGGIAGWASRHLGINFGTGGGSGSWGGASSVSAPPRGGNMTANVNVVMNKNVIGNAVAEFLFDGANGPHTSGAAPDYGYMYRPAVQ